MEFTREELEYLIETVEYSIEEFHEQNPALAVLDKLNEMKNNLCMHGSRYKDENGDDHCKNCGEFIND